MDCLYYAANVPAEFDVTIQLKGLTGWDFQQISTINKCIEHMYEYISGYYNKDDKLLEAAKPIFSIDTYNTIKVSIEHRHFESFMTFGSSYKNHRNDFEIIFTNDKEKKCIAINGELTDENYKDCVERIVNALSTVIIN